MSSSNNSTTTNNGPSKVTGQYHSVKGTVVEAIGDLTGSKAWQDSGRQEHNAGEAEVNAAKAQAYMEGAKDRLEGKKDSVMGALTGDKTQQASGNLQEEKGQKKQDLNRFS